MRCKVASAAASSDGQDETVAARFCEQLKACTPLQDGTGEQPVKVALPLQHYFSLTDLPFTPRACAVLPIANSPRRALSSCGRNKHGVIMLEAIRKRQSQSWEWTVERHDALPMGGANFPMPASTALGMREFELRRKSAKLAGR